MKIYHTLVSAFAVFAVFASIQARADSMASIAINPATGVVTITPQWGVSAGLAGFHQMSQDLNLGGEANDFYSIKGTTIPSGGDIAAFTLYVPASGAATNHVDIGSKLTPNSYSALTSADPDIGYGSVNLYSIHRKSTGDYFTVIVPGSATASAVTDLKPMSGPGGPATLGATGYFGLTFAAANLGYGLNLFYYLRTDPVTGFTKFGILDPALLGTSADVFDLGIGGHKALAFTGTDVGYGTDKMYFLRLDPITGFTILGTLHPLTGRVADIANLGSVYSTLTFVPGDLGFGTGRFYTTGSVNTMWQSVSFAAIPDRSFNAGSFTVRPSASSGLPIALTVITGSATISAPVAGVFTVTPTAPGFITLQATQAGQLGAYESNMLRQGFWAFGSARDFNGDGKADLLWQNPYTGQTSVWLMNGTSLQSVVDLMPVPLGWVVAATGDLNSDGKSDLVWQNRYTGQNSVWLMNGTSIQSVVDLYTVPTGWIIVATGDFNSDGKSDLVWQNRYTGQNSVWLMNGTSIQSVVDLYTVPTGWIIVATGDFNSDGKSDLVWQNGNTGQTSVWLMNGTNLQSLVDLMTVPVGWAIAATGDLNGDGKPDMIWRNRYTGQISVWLMNGTTFLSVIDLGAVDPDWQIRN